MLGASMLSLHDASMLGGAALKGFLKCACFATSCCCQLLHYLGFSSVAFQFFLYTYCCVLFFLFHFWGFCFVCIRGYRYLSGLLTAMFFCFVIHLHVCSPLLEDHTFLSKHEMLYNNKEQCYLKLKFDIIH